MDQIIKIKKKEFLSQFKNIGKSLLIKILQSCLDVELNDKKSVIIIMENLMGYKEEELENLMGYKEENLKKYILKTLILNSLKQIKHDEDGITYYTKFGHDLEDIRLKDLIQFKKQIQGGRSAGQQQGKKSAGEQGKKSAGKKSAGEQKSPRKQQQFDTEAIREAILKCLNEN